MYPFSFLIFLKVNASIYPFSSVENRGEPCCFGGALIRKHHFPIL
jgi:hypothetical protein